MNNNGPPYAYEHCDALLFRIIIMVCWHLIKFHMKCAIEQIDFHSKINSFQWIMNNEYFIVNGNYRWLLSLQPHLIEPE